MQQRRMSHWARVAALTAVVLGVAGPASAQMVQSLSLGAGWFNPRGYAGRVDGDVWVANLSQPEVLPGVTTSLDFEISDFRNINFFGEWNLQVNRRLEVSAGLGYYADTVDTMYRDLVNSAAGFSNILQQLQLRTIPITGAVRFLPFGEIGSFQPYVGGGVTFVAYKYTEAGEFVDPDDLSIFSEKYVSSGVAVGPMFLGGMRVPIGGDVWAFTVEGRYQWASANIADDDEFLGPKLDLSGGTIQFGILIRY